ncbi:hypothetical protein KSS87_009543 [Heliosperma pusillum]|nr:hypothetical protein KSS87_009543 [Heliosperma pusillum]
MVKTSRLFVLYSLQCKNYLLVSERICELIESPRIVLTYLHI